MENPVETAETQAIADGKVGRTFNYAKFVHDGTNNSAYVDNDEIILTTYAESDKPSTININESGINITGDKKYMKNGNEIGSIAEPGSTGVWGRLVRSDDTNSWQTVIPTQSYNGNTQFFADIPGLTGEGVVAFSAQRNSVVSEIIIDPSEIEITQKPGSKLILKDGVLNLTGKAYQLNGQPLSGGGGTDSFTPINSLLTSRVFLLKGNTTTTHSILYMQSTEYTHEISFSGLKPSNTDIERVECVNLSFTSPDNGFDDFGQFYDGIAKNIEITGEFIVFKTDGTRDNDYTGFFIDGSTGDFRFRKADGTGEFDTLFYEIKNFNDTALAVGSDIYKNCNRKYVEAVDTTVYTIPFEDAKEFVVYNGLVKNGATSIDNNNIIVYLIPENEYNKDDQTTQVLPTELQVSGAGAPEFGWTGVFTGPVVDSERNVKTQIHISSDTGAFDKNMNLCALTYTGTAFGKQVDDSSSIHVSIGTGMLYNSNDGVLVFDTLVWDGTNFIFHKHGLQGEAVGSTDVPAENRSDYNFTQVYLHYAL
jgi:hypothetical protein